MLIDTGADRTVISANVLESLNAQTTAAQDTIGGVGGPVASVLVKTQIRLSREDGQNVTFRGQYAACTDYEDLDMSVLGRDILEMFVLIMDRPADIIAIIGSQHSYTIAFQPAES